MKAFDLFKVKKQKKITKQEKKRQKLGGLYFIVFLCVIGLFFIIFFGRSAPGSVSVSPIAQITGSPSMAPSDITAKDLKIKLLNGTGQAENTEKIKKLLTDAGFRVAVTENALSLYSDSVIYYKGDFDHFASEIKTVLSSFSPETKALSQETSYDLIIVIGTK